MACLLCTRNHVEDVTDSNKVPRHFENSSTNTIHGIRTAGHTSINCEHFGIDSRGLECSEIIEPHDQHESNNTILLQKSRQAYKDIITRRNKFVPASSHMDVVPWDPTAYKQLRQNAGSAADIPQNCANKNRYSNILSMTSTRVPISQIRHDSSSTYINANFIKGFSGFKSEYIACQGPLPSTVDDFWRMVWEQNVKAIVMVTGLIEKLVNKCARYWPFGFSLKEGNVKSTYGKVRCWLIFNHSSCENISINQSNYPTICICIRICVCVCVRVCVCIYNITMVILTTDRS